MVSEEKDKYLAMASLVDIGEFIPDLDTELNVDLLPIAFNACVLNRANKNDDVVDTKHGIAMAKHFINKPINIEHNREKVVGTILTAGYSEFGTDRPLTEDQVKDTDSPFNITLGGVIWKIVNSRLAEIIENASDPTSEDYMRVSASWELGFSEFNIFVTEGEEKNIEDAELISDEVKVEEFKDFLKGFGGDGTLEDGRRIYRHVIGDIIPLGVGLTEAPAADVKGITVEKEETKADKEAGYPPNCNPGYKEEGGRCVKIKSEAGDYTENNKSGSHFVQKNVIEDKDTSIMKITNINDITDESLKQLSASSVSDFISEEIKKVSDKFTAEKAQKEDVLKTTQEKFDTMNNELDSVKAELDKMKDEKAEKEALELFNQRMTSFDEEYELGDEARAHIASDLRGMEEETFSAYKKKMQSYLDKNKKTNIAQKEKDKEKALKKAKEEGKVEAADNAGNFPKETPALVEPVDELASELASEVVEEAVDNAVDNAEKVEEVVTNTSEASEASLYEKYKDAFSVEQFNIKF